LSDGRNRSGIDLQKNQLVRAGLKDLHYRIFLDVSVWMFLYGCSRLAARLKAADRLQLRIPDIGGICRISAAPKTPFTNPATLISYWNQQIRRKSGFSWSVGVYLSVMTAYELTDSCEKLIRVRTRRRGTPVELRVQYEITRVGGCDAYRIVSVEDMGSSTPAN
jgi:hypothetical protein